jgi:hypothetical protein
MVSRDVKFLENKSWNDQENEREDTKNPLKPIDD